MATTKATKIELDLLAVVATGGKQYLVKEGDTIKVEKISDDLKVGDKVVFDKILLKANGNDVVVGTPTVASAKVTASVAEIGRDAKLIVIHYKQKSRYFKKAGHRQPFMKVTIDSIK
jgi:large subunit ribosomal protein L21